MKNKLSLIILAVLSYLVPLKVHADTPAFVSAMTCQNTLSGIKSKWSGTLKKQIDSLSDNSIIEDVSVSVYRRWENRFTKRQDMSAFIEAFKEMGVTKIREETGFSRFKVPEAHEIISYKQVNSIMPIGRIVISGKKSLLKKMALNPDIVFLSTENENIPDEVFENESVVQIEKLEMANPVLDVLEMAQDQGTLVLSSIIPETVDKFKINIVASNDMLKALSEIPHVSVFAASEEKDHSKN